MGKSVIVEVPSGRELILELRTNTSVLVISTGDQYGVLV